MKRADTIIEGGREGTSLPSFQVQYSSSTHVVEVGVGAVVSRVSTVLQAEDEVTAIASEW